MQALFKAVCNLFGTGDPDSVVLPEKKQHKSGAGPAALISAGNPEWTGLRRLAGMTDVVTP